MIFRGPQIEGTLVARGCHSTAQEKKHNVAGRDPQRDDKMGSALLPASWGYIHTHIYIIVVANAVHADPGCQLSVVGGTVAQEIA